MRLVILLIILVFIIPFVLDIIMFVIVNRYLTRNGIDPNKYHEIIDKGEVPILVPVEIKTKTAKGKIVNKWYGRGEFGIVAIIEGEEKSFPIVEEEWNEYKTGDEVVFGMEIVMNSKTKEIMENHCKYDIIGYVPEFDMISPEIPLGETVSIENK